MSTMIITDFMPEHVEAAMALALANYMEERAAVPSLPPKESVPKLHWFAENRLGVVAMEGDELVGFLCWYPPRPNFWRMTNVKGVFMPMHAHGAVKEKRGRIYSLLFQGALDCLLKEKVLIYAISLYAHDEEAKKSFFYNGFGMRCIDAMRPMEEITIAEGTNCEYVELTPDEYPLLVPLINMLNDYLSAPPTSLRCDPCTEDQIAQAAVKHGTRYFAAKTDGKIVAYIKVEGEGENFAAGDSSVINISGAYCLPEYRGTGVYNNLLAHLIRILKGEGYRRLGVDCESYNPAARGFWLKHFTEYTNSVVRRMDERILKNLSAKT